MIRIINNTDLYYKEIGEIIDNIQWEYRRDTNHVGKIDFIKIKYKRQNIEIQIRYLKKSIEWRFDVSK